MSIEDARSDLMLAQADVFYRPKDDSIDVAIKALENQKIGNCKDCDKWNKGKRENNKDWYSEEGLCSNWRVITGKDFYCGDFVAKEKQNDSKFVKE